MSGSCRKILRKRMGERQTDLVMDLDLVDPVQLILDRVFGRDDLRFGTADLQQRTVQRRRLARAGRTGDQDDAVGVANDLAEFVVHRLRTCPALASRTPSPTCPGYA